MNEFLTFRKMITPVAIQVIFWIGVIVVVIGGIIAMAQGQALQALQGLLTIIVGPVIVRIYCELLIVVFKIYESLQNIEKQKTCGGAPQSPAPFQQGQQFGQNG